MTSSTRIALCSDTHFWPDSKHRFGEDQSQLQPWSHLLLDTLLAEVKEFAPDLLFHLGDLTCGGGSFQMPDAEFYATVDATYDAFRALPLDFYALPGNHDCPVGGDYAYVEQKFGLAAGQGQTIDLPAARLVLLNAQGHSPAQLAAMHPSDPIYGWVNDAELARLEESLATAGDRPVLLFVHQLLQPWAGDAFWLDLFGVQNAAAVLEILAQSGNVQAVFQGHAHRLDVQQVPVGEREVWFVVQPAIIEYPLAWLQLTLSPEAVQVKTAPLPLPELADISLEVGEDRRWRAGVPAWQEFSIPLVD